MSALFSSLGLKRYIAAIVSLFATLAASVPALAPFVIWLQSIAAGMGAAGELHSAVAGTYKFSTKDLASIVAVLVLIATQVPQLHPFLPILQLIAAALGGATVAKGLSLVSSVKPKSA